MTTEIKVLGVKFAALDVSEFLEFLTRAVESHRTVVVANHNFNSVRLFHLDEKFREYYERAALIYADGVPLIAMARLLGRPVSRKHHVTCNQYIFGFAERAAKLGWRIYFLGSRPGVGEAAFARLAKAAPGLDYVVRHGYFAGQEADAAIAEELRHFRPHVVIVGLGMPRQEHWVVDHFEMLDGCVVMNLGACMDFVAGLFPIAPGWMSRNGLEWLYRLAHEPRRLGRRYLVEGWFVVWLFIRELAGRAVSRAE